MQSPEKLAKRISLGGDGGVAFAATKGKLSLHVYRQPVIGGGGRGGGLGLGGGGFGSGGRGASVNDAAVIDGMRPSPQSVLYVRDSKQQSSWGDLRLHERQANKSQQRNMKAFKKWGNVFKRTDRSRRRTHASTSRRRRAQTPKDVLASTLAHLGKFHPR